MRTIRRDDAQHWLGAHRGDCCGGAGRAGGCGCEPHLDVANTTAARRRAFKERQRDLEQELADIAGQLRDLSSDQPETSE